MGADSEPESTIVQLHGKEEKIIEESGIPYTFLRPLAFMQNFVTQFSYTIRTQNALRSCRRCKNEFCRRRRCRRYSCKPSPIQVNKAYSITDSDALSYSQAAEILSSEVGKKISEEDARKEMKQMGADDWFIDVILELFRIIRAGYGSQTTTAVEHIIGRKPVSFSEFAKDYAQTFK